MGDLPVCMSVYHRPAEARGELGNGVTGAAMCMVGIEPVSSASPLRWSELLSPLSSPQTNLFKFFGLVSRF